MEKLKCDDVTIPVKTSNITLTADNTDLSKNSFSMNADNSDLYKSK